MNTSLIAAAAAMAIACAAAPSFAVDYTPNGFVGIDYSYDRLNFPGYGGADVNTYGLSGSTNVGLNSVLNLEMDADYARVDLSNGGGSFDHGGGYGHLYARTAEGAFGVFGGVHRDWNVTTYDLGLEGAKFYDKFTLGADIRSGWNDGVAHYNATELNLGGHYYLNDSLRLDASTGYDRLQPTMGKFWNGWHIGAGGEYQLKKSPVSIYAKVAYGEVPGWATTNDTAVHVGVRWNFGGGTLKARERSGATFASTGDNDFLRVANDLF